MSCSLLPPIYCNLQRTQDPGEDLAWRCPFCLWQLGAVPGDLPANYLIAPHTPPTPQQHGALFYAKMLWVHCEPWRVENHPNHDYDGDYELFEGSDEEAGIPDDD